MVRSKAKDTYILLDADRVRFVLKKMAVGTLADGQKIVDRIVPPGVQEPEALLAAVLSNLFAEIQTFRTRVQKAETRATKMQANEETLEKTIEALEEEEQRLTKTLEVEVKKVSENDAEVAFLGKRWETLKGEVNHRKGMRDPFFRITQLERALRLEQEKSFGMEIGRHRALRQKATLQETVAAGERMATIWVDELAERRKLDEETSNLKNRLNKELAKSQSDLKKEQETLKKGKQSESELLLMLSKSQANFQTKSLLADELKKTREHNTKETKDLKVEWIASKSVVVKSVEENTKIQEKLTDALAEIKRLQAELATTKKRLSVKEETNLFLERNLERTEEELAVKTRVWKESQAALAQSGEKVMASQSKVKEGEKTTNVLAQNVERLGRKLEEEGNRFIHRDSEAKMYKKELDMSTTQVGRYIDTVKTLEKTNEEIAVEAAEAKAKHKIEEKKKNEVVEQLQSTKEELEEVSKDALSRGRKVETLHKDLIQEEAKLDDARVYGKKLQKSIKILEDKLKVSFEGIKEKAANYEEVAEKLHQVTEQLQKHDQEARDLNAKKEDVEVNLAKVEKEQASVTQAFSTVAMSLQETRSEVDVEIVKKRGLEKELRVAKSQLADFKQDTAKLEGEIKELTVKLNEECNSVRDANSQIFKLTADSSEARQKVATSLADVKSMVASYEKVGEELQQTRLKHQDERKKVERLSKQLEWAQAELREAMKIDEESAARCVEAECNLVAANFERKAAVKEVRNVAKQVKSSKNEVEDKEKLVEKSVALAKARTEAADASDSRWKASEDKISKLQQEIQEVHSNMKLLGEKADFREYERTKVEKDTAQSAARVEEVEALAKKLQGELRATKRQLQDAAADRDEKKEDVRTLISDLLSKKPQGEAVPLTGDWWQCASCQCASPAGTKFCLLCGDKRPDERRKAMAEKLNRRTSMMKQSQSQSQLPPL